MITELDHLSYSSVSAYLECGKWWEFKYIKKIPIIPNANLIFGSIWHGTVEKFIANPDSSLFNLYEESWKQTLEKNKEINWGGDTPEAVYNQGMKWVTVQDLVSNTETYLNMTNFLRTIRPGKDENGKYLIERELYFKVPGVEIPIECHIDIITEDGIPSDFKTSSKSWSQTKAEDEIQPLFYLIALNQAKIPVPDFQFRHFVFIKTKTPKVQVFQIKRTPGQMFTTMITIRSVWESINKGIFNENPGSWKCNSKYCDFWRNCRGKYV